MGLISKASLTGEEKRQDRDKTETRQRQDRDNSGSRFLKFFMLPNSLAVVSDIHERTDGVSCWMFTSRKVLDVLFEKSCVEFRSIQIG